MNAGPASALPRTTHVLGALGIVPEGLLRDGTIGNVGLVDFYMHEGKMPFEIILDYIVTEFAPRAGAYPGPRSLWVFDNMPEHRVYEAAITAAFNARGAFVLWNPPNSPHLNPIEKLWDVSVSGCTRRIAELAAGLRPGGARPFLLSDLYDVLTESRLSMKTYEDMFSYE